MKDYLKRRRFGENFRNFKSYKICLISLPSSLLLPGCLLFVPKIQIMMHYHKRHNDTRSTNVCSDSRSWHLHRIYMRYCKICYKSDERHNPLKWYVTWKWSLLILYKGIYRRGGRMGGLYAVGSIFLATLLLYLQFLCMLLKLWYTVLNQEVGEHIFQCTLVHT